MHHDVGQHQRRRHVVALAGETQPIGDTQRLGLTDQARRIAFAPLVRAHQHAAHIAPRHPGQCLDQHRLALPARQPAGQQQRPAHHPAAATPAPAAPSDRPTRRPDRTRAGSTPRGMTRMRVGSVPWRATIMLGDEAAGRDHPLALRHHRVVAALERQVLAVGAVVGGDEVRAGAPAGEPGRPRRRARACMHDRHPLRPDQRREPRRVAPDRQRVPAGQRQNDVAAAGALHRGHQPPAGAGHQAGPAGADDRLVDLDRAALHAAGDQRRQHLQHGDIARVTIHG